MKDTGYCQYRQYPFFTAQRFSNVSLWMHVGRCHMEYRDRRNRELYRRLLKRKTLVLAALTFVLLILIVRTSDRILSHEEGERGEELVIPDAEDISEETQETWTLPEADAHIRVLLLGEDGSIYHEEKTLSKSYPGELFYYEEEDGFVIVNEVPLEEYLRRVVPSEMPSAYALEAQKAQAVCARTYAVWQMREYAYPEYEAHVDDSVSYQVYNNIENQPSADQAVADTAGQIMLYKDEPVKAYYFATSCGSTTDENIWEKGDRESTPYIAGRMVSRDDTERDLTDEEAFGAYIKKKHGDDLEISEPWYRWSCYVPLSQIQKNIERWANERAARTEDGILLRDGDDYIWPDETDIGEVESARVIERNTGGAVQQMLLTGEKGTLKIKYEYNIRLMLGIPGQAIHKNDGTDAQGGNLLPSGYFVLEPVTEDGTLTGYQVYGGGLGHGAGMSQNGARILAEQGMGFEEILAYFYQGIHLAKLE